jgi:hypothetical protein
MLFTRTSSNYPEPRVYNDHAHVSLFDNEMILSYYNGSRRAGNFFFRGRDLL